MKREGWKRWMGRIAGLLICAMALSFVLPGEGIGVVAPEWVKQQESSAGVFLEAENKYDISDPEDDPLYVRMVENGLEDEAIQEDGTDVALLSTITAPQTYSPYTGGTYTHESQLADSTVIFGIDVSKWQGEIDWKAVAADGIKFAFIRCGYSGTSNPFHMVEDIRFEENIQGAYDAGIAVGIYYFSQAMTEEEAQQEAETTIKLLAPYADKITLPVVFDLEKVSGSRAKNLNAKAATDAALVWLQMVKEAGYTAYYYGSSDVLGDLFDLSRLGDYGCWVARYSYATKSSLPYDFWQYAATGKVVGIVNAVDCNFYYADPLGDVGQVTVAEEGDTLTLNWDAVPGATHYQVCRSETSGSGYARIATVTADVTSYRDSGLAAGGTYYYRVRAYSDAGYLPQYSSYTQESSGTVAETAFTPSQVTGLTDTECTTDSITLKWDSCADASGYEVYRSANSGGDYQKIGTVAGGTTVTYRDTGLTAGTKYYYQVRACYDGTDGTVYGELSDSKAAETNASPVTENTGCLAKTICALNLRSGAGTNYGIVTVLPSGAEVTVLEKTSESWYKISYTDRTGKTLSGYASARYLKEDSAADSGSSGETGNTTSGGTAASGGMVKATCKLNLRSGASLNDSILTTMSKGAVMTVLEKTSADWYRVSYTDGAGKQWTGYVSTKYLTETTQGESTGAGTMVKATCKLNLRSGASLNDSILTTMSKGAVMTVLEKTSADWYRVSYTDGAGKQWNGYVSTKYLTETTQSGSTGSTGSETLKANTSCALNLRSGAGTSYSVVTVLPKGAVVAVLEKTNANWYKVSYTDGAGKQWTGYASAKYLTETGSQGGAAISGTAVKATCRLNLRSGASLNNSILTTMSKGAVMTVLEKTSADWYKVSYTDGNGKQWTGYVSTKYLTEAAQSSGNAGSTGAEALKAKASCALNLRSGAGTSYNVLMVLPSGAEVTVLEKTSASWYKVSYTSAGKTWTGYASAKYLISVASSSSGGTVAGTATAKTTNPLNLRSGAGVSHSVVTVLPSGAEVKVLEKTSSTWYKVSYTNAKGTTWTGYVNANYLK